MRNAAKATPVGSLLVAVDFSAASRQALAAATALARDLGVGIVLLHASAMWRAPPGKSVAGTGAIGKGASGKGATRQGAKGKKALVPMDPVSDAAGLSELAAEARAAGVPVETVAAVGEAAPAALREAAARRCSAVVIAPSGKGRLESLLVGSTAKELLRNGRLPILVVPGRAKAAKRAPAAPKAGRVVLAAMDFSPEAERAYDAALGLAKDLTAQVRLVHVVPLPMPITSLPYGELALPPDLLLQQEEEAAGQLARLASRGRQAKVAVVPSVQMGHAPSVILAEARQAGASLIVLGTHGQSRTRRFFLGSVAQAVVQLADRPVLVVPDPAAAPAGAWSQ